MWLLKTGTHVPGQPLKLELHHHEGIEALSEAYAILSHTWGKIKDEVLFEDLLRNCDSAIRQDEGYISVDLSTDPAASIMRKRGWFKIGAALNQARNDGHGWLWADTCCIDKASSAELSEAINSMYTYYANAAACYAFLADVSSEHGNDVLKDSLNDSRWFTRGWTLQELIAPSDMTFYSKTWSSLGSKHSLAAHLSAITKIDEAILDQSRTVDSASVAQRMSWAADRRTSRIEDQAYSLMGFFSVNMPMLYGEGKKAFLRLQQEIMKISDDRSIFAWTDADIRDRKHGLLADSPTAFAQSSRYRIYTTSDEQLPFDMSNRGLNIQLPLTPAASGPDMFLAALPCPDPSTLDGYLAIYLERLPTGDRQYARIRCDEITILPIRGTYRQVFVRSSFPSLEAWDTVFPIHLLNVQKLLSTTYPYKVTDLVYTPFEANELKSYGDLNIHHERLLEFNVSPNTPVAFKKALQTAFPATYKMVKDHGQVSAVILCSRSVDDEQVAIVFGAGADFGPAFDIIECSGLTSLKELDYSWVPSSFNESRSVQHHHVTVRVKTQVQPGVKVYIIEVYITGKNRRTNDEDIDVAGSKRKPRLANRIGKMKLKDIRK